MNEDIEDAALSALENRSRALFHDSVDGLDLRVRSRLTQARHAALDAAAAASGRSWFRPGSFWTPAAGVCAAALLGVALWFGMPGQQGRTGDTLTNLEDLDIVAASEPGVGDALEMLQDDIDFYDFAEKAASSAPAA